MLDGEVRNGGRGRGERGEEVGDLAHVALVGLRLVHDVGVKPGAGDDDEAVALDAAVVCLPEQLAHVDALGATLAARLGERGLRVGQVLQHVGEVHQVETLARLGLVVLE